MHNRRFFILDEFRFAGIKNRRAFQLDDLDLLFWTLRYDLHPFADR